MSNTTANLSPALQAHRDQDVEACLAEVSPILTKSPHHPVALHLKAWAISRKGQNEEALNILAEVVDSNPRLTSARAEYGSLLLASRRHADALEPLSDAHRENPDRDELTLKYARCLLKNQKTAEAEGVLRKLVDRAPHYFEARQALALTQLHQGRWKEGFDQYRVRRWIGASQRADFSEESVEWAGTTLEQRSLLIECEQSSVDQIMFIRYVQWVRDECKPEQIIVLAPTEMQTLFMGMECIDQVVTDRKQASFDFHIPLLHLPFLHETTPETIPFADSVYLNSTEAAKEKWASKFQDKTHRIGVCWRQGEHQHFDLIEAELLCEHIASMFKGAEIVSLQGASNRKERKMIKRRNLTHLWDQSEPTLSDAAAVIEKLDLVVSIDCAIAHLSGAMGRPVWNLLPTDADWRWSQDDEYTDWYPNMRLFRRESDDDWYNLEIDEQT